MDELQLNMLNTSSVKNSSSFLSNDISTFGLFSMIGKTSPSFELLHVNDTKIMVTRIIMLIKKKVAEFFLYLKLVCQAGKILENTRL